MNFKINKILFWRENSNDFFFLIILANLFSSLFSQHVKRRKESKVQDAGNKFLSTATLLCCVGYLSDNAWTCSCEKYSSQTETQKWHNEDVVYVISKRSTIHLNWNGDFFVTFSLDKSRWIKDGNVSLINLFFPKNSTLVKTFIKVNFIFWTQFDRRFWMEIAKNFKIFAWKLVKIEFFQFFISPIWVQI